MLYRNPQLDTQQKEPENILAIREQLKEDKYNADLWMELGLALAKERMMYESVEAYSRAISIDPFKGIYYRHRAHRHLSCWEIEEALADFVTASRLIPENWDVWYHLALSYYLLGDLEKAEWAYRACYEVTNSDDKLIAVTNWYWATCMRLGKTEKAAELLTHIRADMDPGEDGPCYLNMLLVYKGEMTPEEAEAADDEDIYKVTVGYGMANYYYSRGEMDKFKAQLDKIMEIGQKDWRSAFGYLATRVDLGIL
ncbi:MAG: hypothetical protein IKL92_03040 [Oscillospiraceae bacterium]|nr:hypothetical protein [Oscillospiraceae bacterium]